MQLREFDWLGFVVRFICGAGLGTILVFSFYFWLDFNSNPLWWIVGGAIGFGIASAVFGDDLWEAVGDWGWWGW